MVGFFRYPTIEENLEDPDHNSLSIDPSIIDIEDFCSSLLNIDTLSDWTEVDRAMDDVADLGPNLEKGDSGEKLGYLGSLIEQGVADLSPKLEKDDSGEKLGDLGSLIEVGVPDLNPKLEKDDLGEKLGDLGSLIEVGVADLNPNLEKVHSGEKSGDSGYLIEKELGKVRLGELAYPSVNVNGLDGVKKEKVESGGSSLDSESESESSSTDSSSSSEEEDENDDADDDDEDDGEEVKEKVEMEDGEIKDSDVEKMVAWSDDELDDEDGGVSKGPIKSKNELKDLPPVPPVDVSLQPHHHTVPVGVISSILGAQVIVEGVEQHNPLNEGTIFWITESRTPLGLVDEIFGPVKSPFYIIRYNSEDEVPEGIKQGTSISFVPQFANHVLKDNLYKKGYDASGENDEEISDEYEFSDDEKEAEYRKLQKMKKKRGTNDTNCVNEFNERKNFKNHGGGPSQRKQFSRNRGGSVQNNVLLRNGGGSVQNNAPQGAATQVVTNQDQQHGTPVATSLDNGNYPNPFTVGQNYGNVPSFIPPFQQNVPAAGFIPPPSVVWTNGMPGQQGMVFPNGMMWGQQNPFPGGVPFPQQFAANQNFPPNIVSPVAQPNFTGAPSFAPWPGPFAQSVPNQQFGAAMPVNRNGQQRPSTPGHSEMARELNQGAYRGGGRGRGPHHRGSGRFGGGRGRHQTK